MGQFKRGLGLAGQSWRIASLPPRRWPPFRILGGAMALVVVAPPALAGAYLADRGDTVPGALLGAVAIYLICFVSAFVGVGLAPRRTRRCAARTPASARAWRVATSRLGAISGWALINALLSIVLRALETRSELAPIAAAVVGGAWSVVSLLAIPAIALEDAGPIEAIKRSGSLFKQHWGGRVTGMAAIGFGVFAVRDAARDRADRPIGVLILSDGGSAGIGGGAALLALGAVLFAAGCGDQRRAASDLRRRAVPLHDHRRGGRRLRRRRPRSTRCASGAARRLRSRHGPPATSPCTMSRHAEPTFDHSAPRGRRSACVLVLAIYIGVRLGG